MIQVVSELDGLRVFIAEDEALFVMELEMLLEQMGCSVVGAVNSVDKVLSGAGDADCVLLDVNMKGEQSYPAALELRDRGVPVVFITGYAELPNCPAALADTPRLGKPISKADLQNVLEQTIAGRS